MSILKEGQSLLTIEQQLQKDLNYIKSDIISKQIDGKYCKYSMYLHAVSVIGLTSAQYINYWEGRYKNYPKQRKVIIKACKDKLNNGLISIKHMINLIKNSNDTDSEKKKAIEKLGGK